MGKGLPRGYKYPTTTCRCGSTVKENIMARHVKSGHKYGVITRTQEKTIEAAPSTILMYEKMSAVATALKEIDSTLDNLARAINSFK